MTAVNPLKNLSPEEYLEQKQVKQFLVRLVNSILEVRPENIERHVAGLLATYSKAKGPVESFPTYTKNNQPNAPQKAPFPQKVKEMPVSASSAGRRYSMISPELLRKGQTSAVRRNAMSSKMTSNTEYKIQYHEKDPEVVAKLEEITKKVDLFNFLQADQRRKLVNAMFKKEYKDGDMIIRQGDQPDNFYILETGNTLVIKNGKQVAVLKPGQYFGELALISGSTRAASIVAQGPVTVWAIDQISYLGLLKEGHIQKRQRYSDLLKNVQFLQALQPYEKLLVADALQAVNDCPPGTDIVKQGENGDEFFIILEGECSVIINGEVVAKLKGGDFFGELALMKDQPRAATIRAGENVKLVKLDRQSFSRLLGPCNQFFQDKEKEYANK